MIQNVGSIDRAFRIACGFLLIALVFVGPRTAGWSGVLGLVLLVTGLVGVCPLYRVFGIRTCAVRS